MSGSEFQNKPQRRPVGQAHSAGIEQSLPHRAATASDSNTEEQKAKLSLGQPTVLPRSTFGVT